MSAATKTFIKIKKYQPPYIKKMSKGTNVNTRFVKNEAESGFSIVEALLTVIIIGILASMSMIVLTKINPRESAIMAISADLETYIVKNPNGSIPATGGLVPYKNYKETNSSILINSKDLRKKSKIKTTPQANGNFEVCLLANGRGSLYQSSTGEVTKSNCL